MHNVEANGASLPALGFGTWTLKGRDCQHMVEAALAAGYRHLDTAALYGNEEAVGDGLRASGVSRADVFVTTKVWWTDLGAADLLRSAEASLTRLGIDRVDLLLIHWPSPSIPLSETIPALNRALEDGLTHHIGVSNFTTALLDEASRLSSAPLVCNQVENHPYIDQGKVYAACRERGMAMVSYCPLHRGSDLMSRPEITGPAARLGRTPGQIVLRWHVQQEGVVAIPRTSRPERLAENAAIFDFALNEQEMAAISAMRSRNARLCDFDFSPEWDAA